MAGGYLRPEPPPSFARFRVVREITAGELPRGGARAVLALARAKAVDAIVVEAGRGEPWRALLARVERPRAVGGVYLFPVRGSSTLSACSARRS
jgi:phage terminase large subunit-like protein